MQAPAAVPHTDFIEHMPSEMRLGHEKVSHLVFRLLAPGTTWIAFLWFIQGQDFFFVRMPSDP